MDTYWRFEEKVAHELQMATTVLTTPPTRT
jgi:hypothetical protein